MLSSSKKFFPAIIHASYSPNDKLQNRLSSHLALGVENSLISQKETSINSWSSMQPMGNYGENTPINNSITFGEKSSPYPRLLSNKRPVTR